MANPSLQAMLLCQHLLGHYALFISGVPLLDCPRPAGAPKGIILAARDERDLLAELNRLTQRLNTLRDNPRAPDVIIFEKAVRYALDGNEFFTEEDVFRAKEFLRIGLERAEALANGDAPWSRAAGLSVRGYVSQIDHSVQPYSWSCPVVCPGPPA